MSPFYITFGFSNNVAFAGEVTQTVSVRVADLNHADESEVRTGGGGYLMRKPLMRGDVLVHFWYFSTVAEAAYPDGQDEADLRELQRKFAVYDFYRITASNCLAFTEFASLNPLPMEIIPTGDWASTKDEKNQRREVTMLFKRPEYA